MASEILAIGAPGRLSAEVIIAAGTQLTICLKHANGFVPPEGALVHILLKDDAGTYNPTREALSDLHPALVVAADGTYKFSHVTGANVGVFSA